MKNLLKKYFRAESTDNIVYTHISIWTITLIITIVIVLFENMTLYFSFLPVVIILGVLLDIRMVCRLRIIDEKRLEALLLLLEGAEKDRKITKNSIHDTERYYKKEWCLHVAILVATATCMLFILINSLLLLK